MFSCQHCWVPQEAPRGPRLGGSSLVIFMSSPEVSYIGLPQHGYLKRTHIILAKEQFLGVLLLIVSEAELTARVTQYCTKIHGDKDRGF